MAGEKIQVFNYGKHQRDFTYIDDIVEGVIRVLDQPAIPNQIWDSSQPDPGSSSAPWRIYNIGNNSPVKLLDYIKAANAAGISKTILVRSGHLVDESNSNSKFTIDSIKQSKEVIKT